MYYGEAQTALDDKGRITLPARFRQISQVQKHTDWYLARGFDRALFLFPHAQWEAIRAQVNRHAAMNPRALDFRRLFYGSVAEVQVDKQGRIAVPPNLRQYGGLSKEVVVLGVETHLEIWSKVQWDAFQAEHDAEYKTMAGEVCGDLTGEVQLAEGAT